ncbi:MAG TPA: hypothetical protein PK074_08860 [Spirochaetales bacterium]|nr:hypothetical protein [Spirochaetales bacterium]HQK34821.1 hypothetical protein [Spirochaetales bacterium]
MFIAPSEIGVFSGIIEHMTYRVLECPYNERILLISKTTASSNSAICMNIEYITRTSTKIIRKPFCIIPG